MLEGLYAYLFTRNLRSETSLVIVGALTKPPSPVGTLPTETGVLGSYWVKTHRTFYFYPHELVTKSCIIVGDGIMDTRHL